MSESFPRSDSSDERDKLVPFIAKVLPADETGKAITVPVNITGKNQATLMDKSEILSPDDLDFGPTIVLGED